MESLRKPTASRHVFSPYTNTIIGEFSDSAPEDIASAIERAQEAQKEWALTPLKERTKIMFNFREILLRDLDEISHR